MGRSADRSLIVIAPSGVSAALRGGCATNGSSTLVEKLHNSAYDDPMLDTPKILQITRDVVTANLSSSAAVSEVMAAPFIDSEGHDALRITVVLRPLGTKEIEGDATLDTLVQIREKLRQSGEDRFPLLEYASEAETDGSGDS